MHIVAIVTVTGAGGFIGAVLVRTLVEAGYQVRAMVRRPPPAFIEKLPAVECFRAGDVADLASWSAALDGADAVVHLVAQVHVTGAAAANDGEYRRVNVAGSVELARACAGHSVKRLVYISTIKVNGETSGVRAFTADDPPAPADDPYARSKAEAEAALLEVARETDVEVAVIRPPLVYGPGVRGNFRALLRAVAAQRPLPLASIENARSLVSVFNLCDLIKTCLVHPAAAGEVFLVCDGEDVSTPELIRMLAASMGLKARLLPCPVSLLRVAGALLGRGDKIMRLCGDLRVDMGKTRRLLDWQPPLTLAEGIERTAKSFVRQ